MTPGNARCRVSATIFGLCLASLAAAQQPAIPSPADAIRAFEAVESWVRAAEEEPPGRAIDVPALYAASVTLRYEGLIVGRGSTDLSDQPGDSETLSRTFNAAWGESLAALPIERDVLFRDRLRDIAGRIVVSVELAGQPVPLAPGDSFATMLAAVDPGVDGVAVRAGDRMLAVFPEYMIVTGMEPINAFRAMVVQLIGQERALDDRLQLLPPSVLAERDSLTFYRVPVVHLAQPRSDAPPIFLHRCARVVPLPTIGERSLIEFADGMAGNLMSRKWPGVQPFGIGGTYDPFSGRMTPVSAPPAEQAVAALALLRYARTPGVDAGLAAEARHFATELFIELDRLEADESDPAESPPAAAAFLIAWHEQPRPDPEVQLRLGRLIERCSEAVRAAFDPDSGFAQTVSPGARGLVACALTRRAIHSQNPDDREIAAAAVREVYLRTEPSQLVTHMPWLGWAELDLAGRGDIPAEAALLDLRDLVWSHQVAQTQGTPPDMVGGIVFTSTGVALPTWNTARAAVFLATMLGDPRLTSPGETPAQIARLTLTMRFLRQLAADESSAFMYRTPAKARLGVRAAGWDHRMPPDATSFSLLSVCELLRSLDAIRRGSLIAPPP